MQDPSQKFWDSVDRYLQTIRTEANGDAKQVKKVFDALLETDRQLYGSPLAMNVEDIDDWQATVDQIIECAPNTPY